MIMFKLLGALLILYIAHALSTGRVYAKRGVWGASSKRDDEPVRYWSTIAIYAVLAAALLFCF
jgi:hypothetical protein